MLGRNRCSSFSTLTFAFGIALSLVTGAVSIAHADEVPEEFQGTWSARCDDPEVPQLLLKGTRVSVRSAKGERSFSGVEASHTWYGGAKASGDRVWLLVSKQAGGDFEFIIAPPPYGKTGALTLEEGHPDLGQDVRALIGQELFRCP